MNDRYDVIIIGAGIAGLVSGNYLLMAGKRVLILEKEKYPGGCACSFTRNGYRFDAAVHWISQAGEGGIVNKVLNDLGLAGSLEFTRLPRPATVIAGGRRIDLEFGREGMAGAFAKSFPEESAAIDGLFRDVAATKEELWRLIRETSGEKSGLRKLLFNITFPLKFRHIAKYHKKPATDVINDAVKDPALRAALGTLGIFPGISFVHYSWFNSVGLDGDAYYPSGGIQAVPDALAKRFADNGGDIRYGTLVEKIIVEDRVAKGVRLGSGDEIPAGAVVSAGDATNTYMNMVGEEKLPLKFVDGMRDWKPSESFFYVYIGADYDPRTDGFDGTPVWYLPDNLDTKNFPMLKKGALGIGMPSVLDPSLAPEGKSVIIAGMIASCDFMAGCPVRTGKGGLNGNKPVYKDVKKRISDYIVGLVCEAMPGLKDKVDVVVAATPHTFERYTMNRNGASSGWSMAADRQHKLPIRTPIYNLFLTGHWTMNPGGVPAAFVSGMLASGDVAKYTVAGQGSAG